MEKTGLLYGLAAFGFWGFVPIYFKAVEHVSALDILGHRVIWSVPLTAIFITWSRGWSSLGQALSSKGVLCTLFITACLIGANWLVFIYAVTTDRLLQASLGYFINPLVNVLLGMVFLGERIRPRQWVAVSMTAAGTMNLVIAYGRIPWIALGLAFTFGFYGLLRKRVKIDALGGLFIETSLLFPLAAAYLLRLALEGKGAFVSGGLQTSLLLMLAGVVTAVPLVWFTNAAQRLPYTTIGIIQYLSPSIYFLMAVFCYREPFGLTKLLTFGSIWAGLAIFMADALRWKGIR